MFGFDEADRRRISLKDYSTVTDEIELLFRGWKIVPCSHCNGTGMTSDYGNGEDFYGPKECDACIGNGRYWTTPNGRHVAYPGGPFV